MFRSGLPWAEEAGRRRAGPESGWRWSYSQVIPELGGAWCEPLVAGRAQRVQGRACVALGPWHCAKPSLPGSVSVSVHPLKVERLVTRPLLSCPPRRLPSLPPFPCPGGLSARAGATQTEPAAL